MKKLTVIALLAVVIGICFTVSAFADFYVISVQKKGCYATVTIVPRTGQTDCWNASGETISCAGTGQDGDYEMGHAQSVATPSDSDPYTAPNWTGNRFTDNNDGTITDNLTGLIWLKNANCFSTRSWINALSDCNSFASGICGLTDGSSAGDWRLPNFNELRSLVDPSGETSPSLPSGHPFTNVQSFSYWSSTTYEFETPNFTNFAWFVYMLNGNVSVNNKTSNYYVWPVRSGN